MKLKKLATLLGVSAVCLSAITATASEIDAFSGISKYFAETYSNVLRTDTYERAILSRTFVKITSEKSDEIIEEMEIEEQKRIEEEQARIEAENKRNERLVELFGYVPSDDEINMLLAITMAECGNTEPYEGIKCVEYVIINRVKSDRFPDTIYEVVTQKNQFETYSIGSYKKWAMNERVINAWNEILNEDEFNPYENVLFFTAGGYNRYCKPAFVIGNHYFGY